jgi:dihydrolipoamide dehydrogenase
VAKRIAIIGGGPAGYAAASSAAAFGAEATIVECERLGGACTLWDAIPSKTLLDAADGVSDLEHAVAAGLELPSSEAQVDMLHAFRRVKQVVDHQCNGVAHRLATSGVRVVEGRAELVDANTVRVRRGGGETSIACDAVIIATGARPWVPDIAEAAGERSLTTRTIWELPQLPERLIVVGAGSTGCEMADLFQRFGSDVTLVSSRDRILPGEDVDVAWVVEGAFLERGMRILHRSRGTGCSFDGTQVTVELGDAHTRGSHVLWAVGMQPNSDNLGLSFVGVAVSDKGGIVTDEYSRTNIPGIYAAGDVTGGTMLANVAAMQGRHAVLHALGAPVEPIREDAVAGTVFTRPEIAAVGMSEQKAKLDGRNVLVVSQPLTNNPRAVISGRSEGLVKLVIDRQNGCVLGGSLVGFRASEIITTIALAVRAGLTVRELADTGAVNPSVSESLQRCAERAASALIGDSDVSGITFN